MAQTKTSRARAKTSNAGSARSANARSKGSQNRRSNSKAARSAGSTISNVADKAKVPLVAGGAALAGLAGGAALAGRNRRGKPAISIPRPRNGGSTAKALGSAAKEIAKAGYRLGELTAEVRKTREQVAKK
jgi:hypothetical protein